MLANGDFELDGYRMGFGLPVAVEDVDPGVVSWTTQDQTAPDGSTLFGRDTPSGPTWVLDLATNTYDPAEARASLAELSRHWRPASLGTPGTESVLRYRFGGEVRRVYGRPRKFAPIIAGIGDGRIEVVAEFVTGDAYTYTDEARTVEVGLVPPSTGGFIAPFTAPILTASTGEAQGTIDNVGGDAPAPFRVKVTGPITRPTVAGDGWALTLDYTLAADESVTIDTRRKTVLSNFGASLAGYLTFSSRLANARLRPGPDYFRFSGTDSTGTATARVTWRPTHLDL